MMGGQTVLSGAGSGRKLLTALIAATPAADGPTIIFLDFTGVEVATSSFLREAVIGFRDYAVISLTDLYPVSANLAPTVIEELEFFLRARNDVQWVCDIDQNDRVNRPRLIGELDPVQRATLDMVHKGGTVTAPDLATRFPNESIGPTAWNNRLSALAAKRLVIERKVGKTKSFSPLMENA